MGSLTLLHVIIGFPVLVLLGGVVAASVQALRKRNATPPGRG